MITWRVVFSSKYLFLAFIRKDVERFLGLPFFARLREPVGPTRSEVISSVRASDGRCRFPLDENQTRLRPNSNPFRSSTRLGNPRSDRPLLCGRRRKFSRGAIMELHGFPSAGRSEDLAKKLAEAGFSEEQLERVFCPSHRRDGGGAGVRYNHKRDA
jgi:hypothetical protein